MIDYICLSVSLFVIGYLVYQYAVNRKNSNKADKINAHYKDILDDKLTPLGFECRQTLNHPREIIFCYKQGTLELSLSYEPPFHSSRVYATSGRKITLQQHVDQLPSKIRNKSTVPEQEKSKLVDSFDFELELNDTTELKFIQTLDKWLVKNQ